MVILKHVVPAYVVVSVTKVKSLLLSLLKPSVTVNEAGIFNRPHAYGVATADPMPVMLARRTFSDKPVKNNDELTIKWQITIK